jgi:site-specific DNA recombinase
MRTAIYARYSSDQQSGASLDDQIRLCKERIAREGWSLEQVYRDAAISGASTLRPGYQAMLEGVRDGGFDIVLAEALDRLSRDQEDVAGLYKRLRFAGVRLITLAEGEISELHIGLKGTMNALFLKDLADKTRRGLRGRVAAGKSAGGIAYGYKVVRSVEAHGEAVRGDRAIDAAEAVAVRRIFQMFVDGSSPIAIAKQLNQEGISGPGGNAWRDTAIRGHAERGTGILRNELYIGRMVWNRMRFLKDPTTGKRISRMNDRAAWVMEEVPQLRIVDQGLWDQVQHRLGAIREACGANNPDRPRYWENRRAQHLIAGKTFCASCGGTMSNVGRDYIACGAARKQGTCSNTQGIRRSELERLVLDALRDQLMEPDLVAEFVTAFTAEWNRLAAEASAGRDGAARDLAATERKLKGLIDAIADGFRAPGLQAQLDELEARKAALTAKLAAPAPTVPRLHPNLAEIYRTKGSSGINYSVYFVSWSNCIVPLAMEVGA